MPLFNDRFHAWLDRHFQRRIALSIFIRIWLSMSVVVLLISGLAYYQIKKTFTPAVEQLINNPAITQVIHTSEQQLLQTLLMITLVVLLIAGLLAWWLRHSIEMINRYTQHLITPNNTAITAPPHFYLGKELNQLVQSIDTMKATIENKDYVASYVHTLTHELKSPLTAIRASAELLAEPLPDQVREQFSHTILQQSDKLQQLIERLLLLAKIEQPSFKLNRETTDITQLLATTLTHQQAWFRQKQLIYQDIMPVEYLENPIMGHIDKFWLQHALQNSVDNAIHFASQFILTAIIKNADTLTIVIINDSSLLPDYVLERAFERYFSVANLPTANTENVLVKNKGTGLGLTLVQEVMAQHGGTATLSQAPLEEIMGDLYQKQDFKTLLSPQAQEFFNRNSAVLQKNTVCLRLTLSI